MNHPQYYPVLPWMATLCVNPLETVKNLMAVFVAVCSHDGFEKTLRIADVKLLVQEVFTTFATLNRISMLPVDSIIHHLRKTKCVCQKWLTPMPFWRTARPPHLVTPFGPGIQQTWSNPCGGRKHTIQNTVIICIYIYIYICPICSDWWWSKLVANQNHPVNHEKEAFSKWLEKMIETIIMDKLSKQVWLLAVASSPKSTWSKWSK